jgi:hypothetical protein
MSAADDGRPRPVAASRERAVRPLLKKRSGSTVHSSRGRQRDVRRPPARPPPGRRDSGRPVSASIARCSEHAPGDQPQHERRGSVRPAVGARSNPDPRRQGRVARDRSRWRRRSPRARAGRLAVLRRSRGGLTWSRVEAAIASSVGQVVRRGLRGDRNPRPSRPPAATPSPRRHVAMWRARRSGGENTSRATIDSWRRPGRLRPSVRPALVRHPVARQVRSSQWEIGDVEVALLQSPAHHAGMHHRAAVVRDGAAAPRSRTQPCAGPAGRR